MTLLEIYPQLKTLHVLLALGSGALFAIRGLGVLYGSALPMSPVVRRLSMLIDSALLIAALMLLAALQLNPLAVPWLQAKLVLLLVYIVLGSLALRRARSAPGRIGAYLAALLCYLMLLGVAMRHDPRGWFAGAA